MADLYVDVDALGELARQLSQIKAALESADDGVDAKDGRLGSERIEDALDDFIDGWKDGRKKIIEGIDGLMGRIQGAVDTYQAQEAEIAGAASGGASAGATP